MSGDFLLNSWKEIADYMGRSERTVQRWEREFGLPIRRPAGRARSAVIALPSEILAWSLSTPKRSAEMSPVQQTARPQAERLLKQLPDAQPTLLYIDEHAEALALRKALLEAVGYRVLTASNCRSGLRVFEKNRVDLVVLGYSMPDFGDEAVARLQRETKPRVPILLLSGSAKRISTPVLQLVDRLVQKGQPVATLLTAISELCTNRATDPLADSSLAIVSTFDNKPVP